MVSLFESASLDLAVQVRYPPHQMDADSKSAKHFTTGFGKSQMMNRVFFIFTSHHALGWLFAAPTTCRDDAGMEPQESHGWDVMMPLALAVNQ